MTPGDRAIEILRYLVGYEDQPCRLDHHGYCQDHPGGFRTIADPDWNDGGEWVGERPECLVAAARVIVEDADAEPKPCLPVDCPPWTEFTWNVPASAKTIAEYLGVNPTARIAEEHGAVIDCTGARWEFDSENYDWSIRYEDGSHGDPESWTRVNEFGPLRLAPKEA